LDELAGLPGLWAQATGPDSDALALLALRRWCSGLTLSSPEAAPRPFGLWAWLLGLAALLAIAIVTQGPVRAVGQLFDLPGHARLLAAALVRLRRSGRLVAALLGATVLAWTAGEFSSFAKPERLADLVLLRRSKSLGELAFEQGTLAALTPGRDVFALGDVLVLTMAATVLVFRLSADRWAHAAIPGGASGGRVPPGTTFWWCAAALYAIYRAVSLMVDGSGLPLGGCLGVEALAVPLLMALTDGLLLAWVLAELRTADVPEGGPMDVAGAVALTPGAVLTCLAALPARYLAAGLWLALPYSAWLPKAARPLLANFVRGWGLVAVQGAALAVVGLAGAAAWTRGTPGAALRGYGRLLRAEGGRLVALLAGAGLAAGGLAAAAYLLLLSLPAQAWVLAAADSYAHYATLPVGLVTASALVELGRRATPPPGPAPDPGDDPAGPDAVASRQ